MSGIRRFCLRQRCRNGTNRVKYKLILLPFRHITIFVNMLRSFSIQCISVTILIFMAITACGQGEVVKQKEINYYNSNSVGIKLTSNGWGPDYRFSWRYTRKARGLAEADLYFINDPKEIKLYNPFIDNQKKFVYGKINSFVNLHIGTGYQKEIFSKQDKNSIAIRYQITGGAVLGFEKPIYYRIVDSTVISGNTQTFYYSTQKFNMNIHNTSDIISREPFYKGINETQLKPGIYLRTAMNFEFSNRTMATNALEVGTIIEAYFSKIEILAQNPHRFFFSMYCSYRFGKKYSTLMSRDARKFLEKSQKD